MINVQALRKKLGFLLLALAPLVAALAQNQIPPSGMAQIQSLLQEKVNRTPAQRKMDSQLVHNAKLAAGQRIAPGLPDSFRPAALERSADGLVHVDIDADVNNALLAAIRALGGRVESAFAQYRSIRAYIPLAAAEILAGRDDVHFVKPAAQAINNPIALPGPREANIRTQLANALPAFAVQQQKTHGGAAPKLGSATGPGPDVSGVKAHGADLVQAAGIYGVGVKIGVLSNGVTSLASEQAANRLPAVTVLAGQSGDGPGPCPGTSCPDEGTAMLEIVYSMAPSAQLYYATGNSGEAQFAANIVALQAAGCNIIVDDVTYNDEPVFQNGTVAQAVDTVTAAGAMYFSSAANSGNLDSGTSGTWEGDFNPGGSVTFPETGIIHEFGANNYDVLTGKGNYYAIQWSDPYGGASDDYDLFILDPTGTTVLASSTNTQSGSQPPFERINDSSVIVTNSRIVIVKVSGATRALHLDTGRGSLGVGTDGNTFGHNAAGSGFTVAAVDVSTAGGGIFTGGTANPPESFSSDGPRRIFFTPSGTAITAGNFLFSTNGGTNLAKVDFTATDGVTTGVPGFAPFFGTSAAAPHAAAIAALIKSADPSLTTTQVKNLLYSTSLPVSNFLPRTIGSGIVMANLAVAAVVAPPVITKSFGAATIPLSGATSLSFSITNPAGNSVSVSGIGFTDTLPAGLAVSTPNGLTGTCGGGTITATAGSGTVSLAGATLASGATCNFSVNVTGIAAGAQANSVTVASPLGNGNTAHASLAVIAPPSVSKSFGTASLIVNGTTSLSFTVTNPNTGNSLTGVSFTDTLPVALVVSTPNGLTGSCGGGSVTAVAGSGTVSLAGATLAPLASCTFSVNVTAIDDGVQTNTVTASSTNGGTGLPGTAGITTFRVPTITKAFGAPNLFTTQSTTLTLTLHSPNTHLTLTGVAFSDTLPTGLVVSTPNGESTTCSGTVSAVAASHLVTLNGSALSPGQTCTVTVNVTAIAAGTLTNTTSTLTSTQATPGTPASATIVVFLSLDSSFQVSYAADPSAGESYINVVNTGANGASLLGPGFGTQAGNMCINVYAFAPDEQEISCCSCLLTPNSVANLGVNRDLTSTTLTGVVPTSVVIKLVATLAGTGGAGTSCSATAATEGTLVNGMVAYGTTPQPVGTSFSAAEHTFVPSTLSAAEYASITGRCAAIIGNGSGFGICNSCRSGALGAGKQ